MIEKPTKEKRIKLKTCKNCGKEFDPDKTLNTCCSPRCYNKYIENKAKEKRKIARQKKAVSVSVLEKKADNLWSECVKINFDYKCQYCGK